MDSLLPIAGRNVLVICHDAGGAEIISALVKKYQADATWHCYVAGPAEVIFRRRLPRACLKTIFQGHLDDVSSEKSEERRSVMGITERRSEGFAAETAPKGAGRIVFRQALRVHPLKRERVDVSAILAAHPQIDTLLCEVSWSTGLELAAIPEAKELGLKTIVYLDHWVNYRERFGYPRENWLKHLPDEIWVGDDTALAMVQPLFPPNVTVRLVPNCYFAEIQAAHTARTVNNPPNPGSVLFLSEPVAAPINSFGSAAPQPSLEYAALSALLAYVSEQAKITRFTIRFHPAEPKNKYASLLAKHPGLVVQLSPHEDLLDDLSAHAVVVGIESMALVLAVLCGKRVFSFFPTSSESCPLPYPGIQTIHRAEEIGYALGKNGGYI